MLRDLPFELESRNQFREINQDTRACERERERARERGREKRKTRNASRANCSNQLSSMIAFGRSNAAQIAMYIIIRACMRAIRAPVAEESLFVGFARLFRNDRPEIKRNTLLSSPRKNEKGFSTRSLETCAA